MKRIITNIPVNLIIVITVEYFSIKNDIGNNNLEWFQRSESVLILSGLILGYRSIFREGLKGF